MKKLYGILTIVLPLITIAFTGCYYDNEEDLYVGSTTCDTTSVTYTQDIVPIFAANCNSCHSGSGASGGIFTDNYESVVQNIIRIHGAVNHLDGFRGMPDQSSPLPDCELSKINAWINQQTPQ